VCSSVIRSLVMFFFFNHPLKSATSRFFAPYATRSMRFEALSRPNQKRSDQKMTHRSENLQPSLFETERPCVELRAAQKSELATVIEVLLREIAAHRSGHPGAARPSCPTMHSAPCPTSNCCLSTEVTGSSSRSAPAGPDLRAVVLRPDANVSAR
jgi:hypothetical protein